MKIKIEIDFANDRMINHRRSGKMEIVLIGEKAKVITEDGALWAHKYTINMANSINFNY